ASRVRRGLLVCGCFISITLSSSKRPVQHGRPFDEGDREKQQDKHAERERHRDRALTAALLLRLREDDSVPFTLLGHGRPHASYPAPGKNARTITSTKRVANSANR